MGTKLGCSTVPGYINANHQRVLHATGRKSDTHSNQSLYRMRCERNGCGHEYDANGCDTHLRQCPLPSCMSRRSAGR
jgi:hypothetical protein